MKNSLSFVFTTLEKVYDFDYRILRIPGVKKLAVVFVWGEKK